MSHLDFILLIYMGSHDLLHGFHVLSLKMSNFCKNAVILYYICYFWTWERYQLLRVWFFKNINQIIIKSTIFLVPPLNKIVPSLDSLFPTLVIFILGWLRSIPSDFLAWFSSWQSCVNQTIKWCLGKPMKLLMYHVWTFRQISENFTTKLLSELCLRKKWHLFHKLE